jgi:creatinine amidohydrolase
MKTTLVYSILLILACTVLVQCTRNANIVNKERVLYEELTPSEFRKRLKDAPVAYLPMGTLEWHGEHLPLGSDGIQSSEFFKLLATKAGGIVLPMLFLAPDTMISSGETDYYGSDFITAGQPGKYYYPPQQLDGSAYRVDDNTFRLILEGILKQLKRAGFRIVVAHGHGPSTAFFIRHQEQWEKEFGLVLYHCWCWNIRGSYDKECDDLSNQGYGIMVDHAAANETSLMMAFRPELVHMEYLPEDTALWPLAVVGKDPRLYAGSQFGRETIDMHLERMAAILKNQLAQLQNNE